jgi:hypothetical protein
MGAGREGAALRERRSSSQAKPTTPRQTPAWRHTRPSREPRPRCKAANEPRARESAGGSRSHKRHPICTAARTLGRWDKPRTPERALTVGPEPRTPEKSAADPASERSSTPERQGRRRRGSRAATPTRPGLDREMGHFGGRFCLRFGFLGGGDLPPPPSAV